MTDIPKESAKTILFQFVIFPLGVVLVGVGIFLLFGMLASEQHSIPDYVNEIRSGSSHERWQAAYQLSRSIERGEARKYPNLVNDIGQLYNGSKSDDPRIRRYLSMVLGKLGDRRAAPLLINGLKDREVDNRVYALVALGQLHDSRATAPVIAAMKDEEKDVRKTAAYAAGEIADPAAVPALVEAASDQSPDVRWNAALSLSRFGDPRALPGLHEMLDRAHLDHVTGMREDQKEDAMIMAMSADLRMEPGAANVALRTISQKDPSLRVRAAASQALAKR